MRNANPAIRRKRRLTEPAETLKINKDVNKTELDWWKTLDMRDPYLIKMWSQMFGTCEQRVSQLYIIRNNQNFKKK